MLIRDVVLVFLGGGMGSIVRLGIYYLIQNHYKTIFPLSTLLVNILSCLIVALSFSGFYKMEGSLRLFLIIGFCGGFSTFSAFSYETVALFRSGHSAYAFANILLSILLCTVVIFIFLKKN